MVTYGIYILRKVVSVILQNEGTSMAALFAPKPLVRLLPENETTKDINDMWVSTYPVLKELYTTLQDPLKAEEATCKKYIGDLAGLFHNVFGIKRQFIVPHILANGYMSSEDYDGTKSEFIRLDERKLYMLLTMTKRTTMHKERR